MFNNETEESKKTDFQHVLKVGDARKVADTACRVTTTTPHRLPQVFRLRGRRAGLPSP